MKSLEYHTMEVDKNKPHNAPVAYALRLTISIRYGAFEQVGGIRLYLNFVRYLQSKFPCLSCSILLSNVSSLCDPLMKKKKEGSSNPVIS
jgi:hypothetical protein